MGDNDQEGLKQTRLLSDVREYKRYFVKVNLNTIVNCLFGAFQVSIAIFIILIGESRIYIFYGYFSNAIYLKSVYIIDQLYEMPQKSYTILMMDLQVTSIYLFKTLRWTNV